MFFRIVASRYKKKKYQYLRLMESYREGDRVKQRELMTLANLTQTPAQTINDILEDLRQLITISNSLSSHTGGSAQLSLLLALEMTFQPKKICPAAFLEETLSREREKKEVTSRDPELFFRLIQKYHSRQPEHPDLIFWANKTSIPGSSESPWTGYLMNSAGFPLQYFLFDKNRPAGEELAGILARLKEAYPTESLWTFLPIYFHQTGPLDIIYPDGFTKSNVVICQQRNDWPDHTALSAEQYTVYTNTDSKPSGKIRELINTAGNFLKYYRWHIERTNLIADGIFAEEDFLDMCFMLHLFGKLIEFNIGGKHLLPIIVKGKNTYKYIPEEEPPAVMSQQFSQLSE